MASLDLKRPELILSQVPPCLPLPPSLQPPPLPSLIFHLLLPLFLPFPFSLHYSLLSFFSQFPDSQTYVKVLTKLQILHPIEVSNKSAVMSLSTPHHIIIPYSIPYHNVTYTLPIVPYSTILHHTPPYSTILYHTPPYSTILHHTPPYSTILYHTLPYSTIFYYILPYSTILYYTVLYSTIPYHTRPIL